MKREMDNWRKFILNEQNREPTVGEFMATFGSQSPKAASKILGKVAKFALSAAVGAGAGALAGAATGGAGAALGATAAGATNAMLSKLFEKVNNSVNSYWMYFKLCSNHLEVIYNTSVKKIWKKKKLKMSK